MTEQAEEGNVAETLMQALISKMEHMDQTIQNLQEENAIIKKHMANPTGLLKKMGFVSMRTPFAEDVKPDIFRGDSHEILKAEEGRPEISVPQSNSEFHDMNWSDIHELVESAKDAGYIGNVPMLE